MCVYSNRHMDKKETFKNDTKSDESDVNEREGDGSYETVYKLAKNGKKLELHVLQTDELNDSFYDRILKEEINNKSIRRIVLSLAYLNRDHVDEEFFFTIIKNLESIEDQNELKNIELFLEKKDLIYIKEDTKIITIKEGVQKEIEEYVELNKALDVAEIQQSIIKAINENFPKIEKSNKNFEDRKQIIAHSLKIINNNKGRDIAESIETALLHFNLGEYFRLTEVDTNKAKDCYTRSLETYKNVYKKDNVDIAKSLNKIGICYDDLRNHSKALELYEMSLELQKKCYKEDHPEIATSLNDIGSCYFNLGNCNKALEYHERSWEKRKKMYTEDHPDIATSLNNIGLCYKNLGNYIKALEYHERSLEMKKRIYKEEDHPDIATSLNNIGVCYYYLGKYEEALEYYEKTLEMEKKIYKEDHH